MRIIKVNYKGIKKYFLVCETVRFAFCHEVTRDCGVIISDSKCNNVLEELGEKNNYVEVIKLKK